MFRSVAELVNLAEAKNCSISAVVLEQQAEAKEVSVSQLREQMERNWSVMQESLARGLNEDITSVSGLTGGDAKKLYQAYQGGAGLIAGKPVTMAVARALAVAEVNAAMGRIVAAPTAGSCGILPGVIATVAEITNSDTEKIVDSLFTAAGIGAVIANNASVSGAEGGCQAECGSASAMAAGAAVELAGGTPAQVAHAAAIALKNVLGLVCDPVAGLVEVPCIKRNAMSTANALIAAEMALAGIKSKIPVDEVIGAMKEIGDAMPATLKETACGGLAVTPTARLIERELFERADQSLE